VCTCHGAAHHWHQGHAIRCMAGVHTTIVSELLLRAQASAPLILPCKNRIKVIEPCKQMQRALVKLHGKMGLLCWAMVSPFSRFGSHAQTCTPCFHTASFFHPPIKSIWCVQGWDVRCWKAPRVEQVFSTWACTHVLGASASDQADWILVLGYPLHLLPPGHAGQARRWQAC
jgi:hypothetical protein